MSQNRDWTEGFGAKIRPLLARQEIRFMNAFLPFKAPATSGNVYELRIYRANTGAVRQWSELFKTIMPVREKYSANGSEERRVGKECVSTCRSRGSPDH